MIVNGCWLIPRCARASCFLRVGQRLAGIYSVEATAKGYFMERSCGDGYKTKDDAIILGIESTFDDTGVSIMNMRGEVLGEDLITQRSVHSKTGGTIPTVAKKLHEKHLPLAMESSLQQAKLSLEDIDVIALATGPGLAPCLDAGLSYVKAINLKLGVPILGIHHMEAHALMPRLDDNIDFPYLVMLVSGGHCLILFAKGVNEFDRYGTALDDSPGDAFEKVARALGLEGGGMELEQVAWKGNERAFTFSQPLTKQKTCNTSFSGLRTSTERLIHEIKTSNDGAMDESTKCDIAASFQRMVVLHLVSAAHRALLYCKREGSCPTSFVVSGGVACNHYLREKFGKLCAFHGIEAHFPEPHLCTDNGRMIAWAGVEYLQAGFSPVNDVQDWKYTPKWPLGADKIAQVEAATIPVHAVYKHIGWDN
eukprot:m.9208 g.9208  ORF g.9208 m.9208 type:complete len:423 (+) comp3400_c0_seq1:13-1281(+)